MDSPSNTSNPKMKRRSSSMFNLMDHKNLIEKDLEMSKQAVIRKNNLTRKNYRNDLLVRNRNIDFNNIYEESPQINRIKEPIAQTEIKVEKMDLLLAEPKQEKVEVELPVQPNQNRITNIKNKINTLKNNFRSIIGANSATKKQEQVQVKAEPQIRKPPLPKFNNENDVKKPDQSRFLNPTKLEDQHRRLTQHNKMMRTFNSASNIKPAVKREPLGVSSLCSQTQSNVMSMNAQVVQEQWKKTLRSSDSNASLKSAGGNKPTFKLGTKVTYNDRHLFDNRECQPSSSEITKLTRMIMKRKVAHNLTGSLNSLNSIN